MRHLGMLPKVKSKRQTPWEPVVARSSVWERAVESGLFRKVSALGSMVQKGDLLGFIDNPYSSEEIPILSRFSGIVIGCTEIPVVHEGDAIFHIARFEEIDDAVEQVESFQATVGPDEETSMLNPMGGPPIV